MLDVEVSPITSEQQNTDDRDCPALETLRAITAVDWLDAIRRQLRLVLYINYYGCIKIINWQRTHVI